MTATLDDLTALFVRLAETPSPAGDERAVADLITGELRAAGLEVREDDSASRTGGGAGNLIARIPGRGEGTPVALCAHMDTVPVDGEVRVRIEDGVARSVGETILGADDKAAVTALVALARDLAAEPPAADVEIVITASEEVGLRGAKELDLSGLAAEAVFVFDSEGPVGTVVVSAPSLTKVTAEFHGRVDEQTTANVGLLAGGSAINVVPERCRLEGEARSRDRDSLAAQLERMIEAVNVAAAEAGVDVTVMLEEDFVGFSLGRDELVVRLAAAALTDIGVEPTYIGTGGGADSNVFNRNGLPAVNLGVGFENVHSAHESIALARLAQVYDLAHAIVRVAGAA